MTREFKTERERLNHQAYMDVLSCKQPTLPNNEIYMECYRSWRPLQKFPEDCYDEIDLEEDYNPIL